MMNSFENEEIGIRTRGQIQLILGPMFSGKTTELLRRVKRYQVAKHSCLVIKYMLDKRYSSSQLVTHDHLSFEAVSSTSLKQFKSSLDCHSVVGIDEGQFFPDVVQFAEYAANQGKIVIIAGLDGSYLRRPFPSFLELIPLSEKVEKLEAICMKCYNPAAFTKRISSETDLVVIASSDKYMSVCRPCFFLTVRIPQEFC